MPWNVFRCQHNMYVCHSVISIKHSFKIFQFVPYSFNFSVPIIHIALFSRRRKHIISLANNQTISFNSQSTFVSHFTIKHLFQIFEFISLVRLYLQVYTVITKFTRVLLLLLATIFECIITLAYIISILITVLNVNIIPSFYSFSSFVWDLSRSLFVVDLQTSFAVVWLLQHHVIKIRVSDILVWLRFNNRVHNHQS